jgi:hypothetical protein
MIELNSFYKGGISRIQEDKREENIMEWNRREDREDMTVHLRGRR